MLRSYCAALLLFGICTIACDGVGGHYALTNPVMTEKAADRAVFLWEPSGEPESCIEYWPVGSEASGDSRLACAPTGEVQQVVLSGLQAESQYAYRVISTGASETTAAARHRYASAPSNDKVYQFRTGSQSEQSLHFAVMGDSHGNQEVLRPLLAQTLRDRPNLDFLLHVGDAVNDGDVPGSWFTDFIDPARDFLAVVPIHFAMGNHEKGEVPPFQIPVAAGPVDSFVSGNAFIVLANSNLDLGPKGQQYQELEQRLSSPEARAATWRLVAFHHPPFAGGWGSCDGYDGNADVRENLVPLLTRHEVNVVFNGHLHGYERGTWLGVTYVTTGGGGGSLDHACTPWPHIVVSRYLHHMLNVDVEGKHLSVTARGLDGSVIDQFALDK